MITKMNVLLVDDDPVAHYINRKVLERLGFTMIETANNGQEALSHFGGWSTEGQGQPITIFVDLNMPVLDDFGFIEEFKKSNISNKENVRIAILTSSYDPSDQRRARELGVTHYLTKPASENDLKAVLESTADKAT